MADITWFGRILRVHAVLVFSVLIAACGGGEDEASTSGNGEVGVVMGSTTPSPPVSSDNETGGQPTVVGVINETPITVTGTVIDGPVIDAILTIRDANDAFVAATHSDAQAKFSVQIPANSIFPLTITAAKGINLVTNAQPTFVMMSTVMGPADTTANINPFTTLITKTAAKMPGGLTPENVEAASHNILTVFNAGLDRSSMPDPITTPVTNQNVTMLVKASEVLAEIIRRNFSAVTLVNIEATQNIIIDSLAADLTDGVLDGEGADGSDRLISSSASIISGQVLIEALSNSLQVNDVTVTNQLDSSIGVIMPAASETMGELPITSEMLLNTQTAIGAALLIAPSIALSDILTTVDNLESGTPASEVSTLLLAHAGDSMDPAITTLASSIDSQISVLTSVSAPINTSQTPFKGAPWVLPGKIQAEDYDLGGPGVAYSDTTSGNNRDLYRHDDVDIFNATDAGSGYMVGLTNATEWLEYTVNVTSARTYTLNLRVATALDGRQVRVLMNGSDVTGPMPVPNTGEWQAWQTISKTVRLNAGEQVLRLQIDSGSVNINWIELLEVDLDPQSAFGSLPWAVPGKIEAEHYDLGGAGIAYSDTTSGNNRGYYRGDDVDIFLTSDVGGGYMVGLTEGSEWLEYTVNVATAGVYTINLRVATASDNRQLRVLMSGNDVTGAITVPNTGGWETWRTVSKTVNLSAGQRVMRLQIDSGSVNINSIEILAGDTASQTDAVTNTTLTVSWTPNPESVAGYIVYFGPSASAVTNETTDIQAFAGSFDPASPAIEYDSWYDLGLQLGDNVCFKLRAYNADGLSDWSLPACTTVPLTI